MIRLALVLYTTVLLQHQTNPFSSCVTRAIYMPQPFRSSLVVPGNTRLARPLFSFATVARTRQVRSFIYSRPHLRVYIYIYTHTTRSLAIFRCILMARPREQERQREGWGRRGMESESIGQSLPAEEPKLAAVKGRALRCADLKSYYVSSRWVTMCYYGALCTPAVMLVYRLCAASR